MGRQLGDKQQQEAAVSQGLEKQTGDAMVSEPGVMAIQQTRKPSGQEGAVAMEETSHSGRDSA